MKAGGDREHGANCGLCGAHLFPQPEDGPDWLRIRAYGAAPGEHLLRLPLVSSLFPHLPHSSRRAFHVGMAAVILALVVFALLRWQPPLIAISALGLPLLFLIYLHESCVFDDLPVRTLLTPAHRHEIGGAMSTSTPDTLDEPILVQTPRCRGAALITIACAAVSLALTSCGAPSVASTAPLTTSFSTATTISDVVDHNAGLVVPASVHVAAGADLAQARAVVHTAQVLYTFWNTGDTAFLDEAVTPDFHDNTLPAGRPQGPAGPRAASAAFRTAIPDLTCQLVDLYVTGDTLTARLVFQGHFTGTYNGIAGGGQTINFNAIDIQHVDAGAHIIEDWHLEDNLAFLQQAGLISVAGSK